MQDLEKKTLTCGYITLDHTFQLGVMKDRNETESFTDIVVKVKFMFLIVEIFFC